MQFSSAYDELAEVENIRYENALLCRGYRQHFLVGNGAGVIQSDRRNVVAYALKERSDS